MRDTATLFTLDNAFVVITDYERYSVVLSWDYETHDAPKIIAKEGSPDSGSLNDDAKKKGIDILNFLTSNNIMSSKNEVRRVILNKGLKINDLVLGIDKKFLELKDFNEKISKISFGKKRHYQVKII